MLTASPRSVVVLQWTKVLSWQWTVLSLLTVLAPPSQTSCLLTQVVRLELASPGRKGVVDCSQAGDLESPCTQTNILTRPKCPIGAKYRFFKILISTVNIWKY